MLKRPAHINELPESLSGKYVLLMYRMCSFTMLILCCTMAWLGTGKADAIMMTDCNYDGYWL